MGQDEILKVLTEMRDLQREHFAEYQRANDEYARMQKEAAMKTDRQFEASQRSAQAWLWAILFLIALCLGANLLMLSLVAKANRHSEVHLESRPSVFTALTAEFEDPKFTGSL